MAVDPLSNCPGINRPIDLWGYSFDSWIVDNNMLQQSNMYAEVLKVSSIWRKLVWDILKIFSKQSIQVSSVCFHYISRQSYWVGFSTTHLLKVNINFWSSSKTILFINVMIIEYESGQALWRDSPNGWTLSSVFQLNVAELLQHQLIQPSIFRLYNLFS